MARASEEPDREEFDDLPMKIRQARDQAHWLSVVRRRRTATHIESVLQTLYLMALDDAAEFGREERKKSSPPSE